MTDIYTGEIDVLQGNIEELEERLRTLRSQQAEAVIKRAGNVLKVPMLKNDAAAETIGGYLKALLWKLWEYGDGFSGKRPFGNSGWEYALYKALVNQGLVEGELDDCDGIVEVDKEHANELIFEAIAAAFSEKE